MPAVLSRLSPGCPGFGSAALLYSEVLNTDHETLCSAALTYLGKITVGIQSRQHGADCIGASTQQSHCSNAATMSGGGEGPATC